MISCKPSLCEKLLRKPGEILSLSLHHFVQGLVTRSCGNPVGILFQRFPHIKILKMLCNRFCATIFLGCSCKVFVCFCEILHTILNVFPAESAAMSSSPVTVPQFLLPVPHCLGSLAGVILKTVFVCRPGYVRLTSKTSSICSIFIKILCSAKRSLQHLPLKQPVLTYFFEQCILFGG